MPHEGAANVELIIPGTSDPGAVGILDAKGRTIKYLPREAGRQLLAVDQWLRDFQMEFAVLCLDCRTKARPNTDGTDVIWECQCSRRVSSQL